MHPQEHGDFLVILINCSNPDMQSLGAWSSSTRGVFGGGHGSHWAFYTCTMDYVVMSFAGGGGIDFGDESEVFQATSFSSTGASWSNDGSSAISGSGCITTNTRLQWNFSLTS